MEQSIRSFAKQFTFFPHISNEENLKKAKHFVVIGMGGSHLAADILKDALPALPIRVRKDYGLPDVFADDIDNTLFIASSYSGNTEEVVRAAREAHGKGLNLACVSVGGDLIEFAKKNNIPYIHLPDQGIQPRVAIGFSLVAMARLIGGSALSDRIKKLGLELDPAFSEKKGKRLAESLKGSVPVIYASMSNRSLAAIWKIKFNETGKIPAFYNTFSELNHNEMTGFDVIPSTKELSSGFHFIFIKDHKDDPMIGKRMSVTKSLYEERGFKVSEISLEGEDRIERMLNALLLADWTAFHTSLIYGTEPEQVPMVEDFKKRIAE